MSGEGPVDCNFELGIFYVEDGGMEADAEEDDGEEDNQEVFVDEDKIDPQ